MNIIINGSTNEKFSGPLQILKSDFPIHRNQKMNRTLYFFIFKKKKFIWCNFKYRRVEKNSRNFCYILYRDLGIIFTFSIFFIIFSVYIHIYTHMYAYMCTQEYFSKDSVKTSCRLSPKYFMKYVLYSNTSKDYKIRKINILIWYNII